MDTSDQARKDNLLLAAFGEGWALFADLPGAASSGLLDLLLLWQERAAQRCALSRLEAQDLRDIGLSQAEASAEADKPFWRA